MPGEAQAATAPYARLFSRSQEDVTRDLESFSALLAKWQRVQNLVSRETLGEVWTRHVADSLQILPLLRPTDAVFLDLGSGGGFPAIPLAIALKGPERRFILVEPNGRKASFLRTVVRDLGFNGQVETVRAESIPASALPPIDIVTSRALAPLQDLCRLAAPFFSETTRAIFHKGREHVDELAESAAVWHYDVLTHPSVTHAEGVLLEISNLRLRDS